jgi:hypothetical protein
VLRAWRLIADHVGMTLQVRDAFGAMPLEAPARRAACRAPVHAIEEIRSS